MIDEIDLILRLKKTLKFTLVEDTKPNYYVNGWNDHLNLTIKIIINMLKENKIKECQEALDYLKDCAYESWDEKDEKGNKITKYARVYNIGCAAEPLQELVDKNKPAKPVFMGEEVEPHYRCPNCGKTITLLKNIEKNDYCQHCAKALDWSEIDA